MTYDQWVSTDPDDRELCDHGKPKPCPLCRWEAAEARAEWEREERNLDRLS